ncbi:MAG: hypothetical protein SFY66_10860 [Oculatellaceae cyanobacterium bins.114]|nr:hypothetical protein [Oculatellaceae cyanobacterium bins.114]
MKLSVHITSGHASASNPSIASWVDSRQRLNYLYVYAFTAPDDLVPQRPFVLRVAINKSAGTPATASREKGCRGFNRSWHFELTLLPEEILDFLPWIVSLIKAYDSNFASIVPDPPHPLDCPTADLALFHKARTYTASDQLLKHNEDAGWSLLLAELS